MGRLLLFAAFAWNTSFAGPLILGVRGGMPVTSNSGILGSALGPVSSGTRWTVGPTAGIALSHGFSVEGDLLFSRETFNALRILGLNAGTHVDSWEFPVMLKYAAGRYSVAPVFGAGFSVRRFNDFQYLPSFVSAGLTGRNSTGFVAGGGLRFKAGPVDITPEIRYTRWMGGTFVQSLLDSLVGSRNEAQVLVGFTF